MNASMSARVYIVGKIFQDMASAKISSVFRPGLFRNKVAVVTGGATGIGKAITQELLYLGCKVVIASRNEERLKQVASDMSKLLPHGGSAEVVAVPCNIRKEDQVQNLMKTTVEKFGKLDFLVNNGGGQYMTTAEHIKLKGWNAVVETNLTGTFLCCREAFDAWMGKHGGSIVTIITDMWRGMFYMAHSGAARAGAENLTRTLAVEWASRGIRLNCIAPGSAIYSETAAMNYGDPKLFDRIIPEIPAKRLGTVEEVSAAVCFLLSPAASFISGATLKIDAAGALYSRNFFEIPDHDNWPPPYKWETDNPDGDDSPPASKL